MWSWQNLLRHRQKNHRKKLKLTKFFLSLDKKLWHCPLQWRLLFLWLILWLWCRQMPKCLLECSMQQLFKTPRRFKPYKEIVCKWFQNAQKMIRVQGCQQDKRQKKQLWLFKAITCNKIIKKAHLMCIDTPDLMQVSRRPRARGIWRTRSLLLRSLISLNLKRAKGRLARWCLGNGLHQRHP